MRDFAIDPTKDQEQTTSKDYEPQTDKPVPSSFWTKYICITISEAECRDHFALERTYLAYIRTASAYAQFGVTLAQLFRLNNSERGIGLPTSLKVAGALGAITEAIAILVILTGTAYFIKQQRGLERGHILSRGWDLPLLLTMSTIVRLSSSNSESRRMRIALKALQTRTCPLLTCHKAAVHYSRTVGRSRQVVARRVPLRKPSRCQ